LEGALQFFFGLFCNLLAERLFLEVLLGMNGAWEGEKGGLSAVKRNEGQ